VGSRVVRNLLARADVEPVVAIARNTDRLAREDGLAARRADYDDPPSLRAAFVGIDSLVFVSSDGPAEAMRRHHEHVVAAAVEAGVEHLVYTSVIDVLPDSSFYYAPVHRDTEAMIVASGVGHLLARTSIFTDFLVSTWIDPALGRGVLAVPAGDGRMSLVSRDDVARYLAPAAIGRRRGIAELTGPQALGVAEITRITEAVTGRELRYSPVDEPAYRERLARDGAPAWLSDAFTSMFASVGEGRFANVSADIPSLTGEPADPFIDFLRSSWKRPPSPAAVSPP
jgi:NAD(P)H dehydrogenase (quinone)